MILIITLPVFLRKRQKRCNYVGFVYDTRTYVRAFATATSTRTKARVIVAFMVLREKILI
jgi:hypothetical protein